MSTVRMRALLRRLRRDERGLTTVEYVIVLCLIAALAVGTWSEFGKNIEEYLDGAVEKIDDKLG